MRPTVRGLDLSTTSTGVCQPDGTTESIVPAKKAGMFERCQWTRDEIATMAPCDVYAVEAIGTNHVKSAITAATIHALTLDLILTGTGGRLVTIIKPTPSQLKKWATGKGNGPGTDKTGMVLAATKAGWESRPDSTDDEADAWWLWTLGLAYNDDWAVPETAYRHEILAKLRGE